MTTFGVKCDRINNENKVKTEGMKTLLDGLNHDAVFKDSEGKELTGDSMTPEKTKEIREWADLKGRKDNILSTVRDLQTFSTKLESVMNYVQSDVMFTNQVQGISDSSKENDAWVQKAKQIIAIRSSALAMLNAVETNNNICIGVAARMYKAVCSNT